VAVDPVTSPRPTPRAARRAGGARRNPWSSSNLEARAADASLGQLQYRTMVRSRGTSSAHWRTRFSSTGTAPGNPPRIEFECTGRAHIDDDDILAGIEQSGEVADADARNALVAQ
jgi:hypothetical protein